MTLTSGHEFFEIRIPEDMTEMVEEYRMKLIEGAAEESEELLEKFLDDHDSTHQPKILLPHSGKPPLKAASYRFFVVHLSIIKAFRNLSMPSYIIFPARWMSRPVEGINPFTDKTEITQCR